MIRQPAPLTLRRWWRLVNRPQNTLMRLLQNERIEELRLTGTILDVGGGRRSGYAEILHVQGTLHTVNVEPSMRPSFLADLSSGIPARDASYDYVICFNTLEHLLDDRTALSEIHRVLKPGGHLYVAVPFLYRIHASPGDYHRHTATAWLALLLQSGFPADGIEIEPLAFGPFATPLSFVEFRHHSIIRRLLRAVLLLMPIARERLRHPDPPDDGADIPLGYFFRARA
jgi:SAM-dependent methyltransferase